MSQLFYDHLVVLEDLERELRDIVETPEEREELWQIVDEIIHHRVLGCILDHLPQGHHETFITLFHDCPHNQALLKFVDDLTEGNIAELIGREIANIQNEILQELID